MSSSQPADSKRADGVRGPAALCQSLPASPGSSSQGALAEWRRSKPALARRLDVLKPFDPWSSPMCTCPPKLALDVYCGCGYECLYCYVSAYNPRCWGRQRVRPKKDLLRRLERDVRKIADRDELAALRGLPVAVSNSSDPYPCAPAADEGQLRLTRDALRMLADAGFPLLVTTKSPLVCRDLDVLLGAKAVVALTVTTLDDEVAAGLEPLAAPPADRLEALAHLAEAGVPVVCRLDPLVPSLTATTPSICRLLDALAEAGVRRMICSTYKYKPDSFRRLARAFPSAAGAIEKALDKSQRISGYYYLHGPMRQEMLETARELAHERGLAFTVCREGLGQVGDGVCDARDLSLI